MAKVYVWVPLVGKATDEDPRVPDTGDLSLGRAHDFRYPIELRPTAPGYSCPLTSCARITVEEEDAPKVTTAIQPTMRDVALVEMCGLAEEPGTPYLSGQSAREAMGRVRDALGASDEAKRAALDGLAEAVRRGLRRDDADALVTEFDLGGVLQDAADSR